MLSSLTLRKAPGIDTITADMLRLTATLIAPAVTLLFNHILWLGKLPKDQKTSVVVPIPKNKKNLLSSYRPISLLPIVSKVLERHNYCEYPKESYCSKMSSITQSVGVLCKKVYRYSSGFNCT